MADDRAGNAALQRPRTRHRQAGRALARGAGDDRTMARRKGYARGRAERAGRGPDAERAGHRPRRHGAERPPAEYEQRGDRHDPRHRPLPNNRRRRHRLAQLRRRTPVRRPPQPGGPERAPRRPGAPGAMAPRAGRDRLPGLLAGACRLGDAPPHTDGPADALAEGDARTDTAVGTATLRRAEPPAGPAPSTRRTPTCARSAGPAPGRAATATSPRPSANGSSRSPWAAGRSRSGTRATRWPRSAPPGSTAGCGSSCCR